MLTACFVPDVCAHPFETRAIRFAFHDIDGTHSLIREWPPVMSAVLNDVIERGLPDDFDSPANRDRLIAAAGTKALEETDRFCVDSAGLSALTQMEWAIRRAIEEGRVKTDCDPDVNRYKIGAIHAGREVFDDLPDSPGMTAYLREYTPRLFRLYEAVLNGYCRDRNLLLARQNPEAFRVKGSMAFLRYLHAAGVKNFFVTGAVVEKGMGMFEEVEALGYEIGPGRIVEDIIGSTWDCKMPKNEIMRSLLRTLGATGSEVLVTGDGRSEIAAGVEMGAVTISRLNEDAVSQRKLHLSMGTNLIVRDFDDPAVLRMLRA